MGSLIRAGLTNFVPKTCRNCLASLRPTFPSHRLQLHTSYYLNVKGQEIKMPSLSPTMSEGTIVKWLKKEGDPIKPGDVLCDIQTDKAVVSMETEEEGTLAKILMPEDSKDVRVGTLIALMVPEGEDWTQVETPDGSGSINSSQQPVQQTSSAEGDAGPPVIKITMPSLSPTMTEGTIVQWLKKEGDAVSAGDALCEIQTDKAVITMDTEEEGTLAKILKPSDSKNVRIGELIALIVPEGEDWKAVLVPKEGAAKTVPSSVQQSSVATKSSSQSALSFGPAVRALLDVYQIQASSVTPSGRKNKLLKEDVLKFIKINALQKKPPIAVPLPKVSGRAPEPTTISKAKIEVRKSGKIRGAPTYRDIELSNVRKVIAKRLSESKRQIPHAYSVIACRLENLQTLRKELTSSGVKVSVNDVVIKAVAAALEQCPGVNAIYGSNGVQPQTTVDISVAVATENGLITPIVRNANHRTLSNISTTVRELAGRAKIGKLKPEEFQGGSFTISNLGMFGVTEFSAIINPPQCAILAVGGAIPKVATDDGSQLCVLNEVRLTLSYDTRAIDNSEAAQFLSVVQALIENPKDIIAGVPPKKVPAEHTL